MPREKRRVHNFPSEADSPNKVGKVNIVAHYKAGGFIREVLIR